MSVGIKDVASYLPPKRVRNVDVAEELGFKPGFLEDKVGVEVRCLSTPEESTSDMCVQAFSTLAGRYPEGYFGDVGLLLLCTQNPDFKLPHTSSVLQARLGLPKNLLAFDISLGCSGYVASVVTAKALMNELGVRKALVFTCDPYSKVLDPKDKSTVPLFSDAATVTLMEDGGLLEIGHSTFGNDGSLYETLIIRGSGTARGDGGGAQPLRMDGRNIFAMLKTEVPANIRACAAANGIELEDVEMFLFHQASGWLLKVLSADLKLSPERVPSNLKHVGNTVSSSIPVLLDEVLRGEAPIPKTMLWSGFGVGLSWASVVVTRRD